MTMYGAIQPKSDVDKLHIKRKERGRGLMSVERCVRKDDNSLGFHVSTSVMSGEFKSRKHKNLNKTSVKRKCMGSSSGIRQRKLIRIKLGNGYTKVICRSEQKRCYVLHRNRPSGQTM